MPPRKKPAPRKKKAPAQKISFKLSLNAVAGVAVVMFCLFLWMFLIGIWAGRTIIYPPSSDNAYLESDEISGEPAAIILAEAAPVRILIQPRERKKRVAPLLHQPSLAGEL